MPRAPNNCRGTLLMRKRTSPGPCTTTLPRALNNCRGASLMRKRTPRGPYRRTMPRALNICRGTSLLRKRIPLGPFSRTRILVSVGFQDFGECLWVSGSNLTQCFHQLVSEIQLPRRIVHLLCTISNQNMKLTVLWGS